MPRTYLFTIIFSMMLGWLVHLIWLARTFTIIDLGVILVICFFTMVNEKWATFEDTMSRKDRRRLRYALVSIVIVIGFYLVWR